MNRKGFLKSLGVILGSVVLAPYIPKLNLLPINALTELTTAQCNSNFEGDWHSYAATNDGKYYRDGVRVSKEKCIIEFRSPECVVFGNDKFGASGFWDGEASEFSIKGTG